MQFETRDYGTVKMDLSNYENGSRLAIQLVGAKGSRYEYEPIATLTVNIPDQQLGFDEFFVKGYAENARICEDAMKSGLFVDTGRKVHLSPYADAYVWKFSRTGLDAIEAAMDARKFS